MPAAIASREVWAECRMSAIALGSIKLAAQAHGLPEMTVYQRARRESWPVGQPASIRAARAERIEHAQAAGVTVSSELSRSVKLTRNQQGDALDSLLQEQGRATRAMLSTGLMHAAGQARRTKHPLDRARDIKAVTEAAAQVHGWDKSQGADAVAIQININAG